VKKIFIILLLIFLADRNCNPKSVTPDYASAEQLSGIATGVIMFTELIEQWKPIKGYEGYYEISNFGKIKSLRKFFTDSSGRNQGKKERILVLGLNGNGYLGCHLSKENKTFMYRVHLLVWDYFGEGQRDDLQVDHKDDDKLNNRIDNLQLLTARENTTKAAKRKTRTSEYTGVYWHEQNKKWCSQIGINGVRKHLGYFTDENIAAQKYQEALDGLG
jgi:hypothetical protein